MQFLRFVEVAGLVVVPRLSAQTAPDSSQVLRLVAETAGARLRSILTDSSGAHFKVPGAATTWSYAVYAAIRELYPETARQVFDSTYRATIVVESPVFRGDTVDVSTLMTQCKRGRSMRTFFANRETLRFARALDRTWRLVPTSVRHADGVC